MGHVGSLEKLELPKINIEEATTFHNGEQNKLEDITKNTKLEIGRPIKNHPSEIITIEPKTSWEVMWDLT